MLGIKSNREPYLALCTGSGSTLTYPICKKEEERKHCHTHMRREDTIALSLSIPGSIFSLYVQHSIAVMLASS
jgi:hypothetical protein